MVFGGLSSQIFRYRNLTYQKRVFFSVCPEFKVRVRLAPRRQSFSFETELKKFIHIINIHIETHTLRDTHIETHTHTERDTHTETQTHTEKQTHTH